MASTVAVTVVRPVDEREGVCLQPFTLGHYLTSSRIIDTTKEKLCVMALGTIIRTGIEGLEVKTMG